MIFLLLIKGGEELPVATGDISGLNLTPSSSRVVKGDVKGETFRPDLNLLRAKIQVGREGCR